MIQTQALQDRNVPDKQQWETATKFMENVLNQELEREQAQLISTVNPKSWKRYIGLQRSTIEEKYREQCVKELEKVLVGRKQLDQSMKKNQAVRDRKDRERERDLSLFSFDRLSIRMN